MPFSLPHHSHVSQHDDKRYTVGQVLDAFDELAREDNPFRYPIYYSQAQSLTQGAAKTRWCEPARQAGGRGRPGEDVDDWENLVVGSHPDFVALIERSRRLDKPGTGIPFEEMRRRYGLPRKAARQRRASEWR